MPPSDKRSSSLLFHPVIRFVGGLTGAIAALFVTGYLADRALYRFAGLPMISVDQQSLAERGAQVFIESVGSLFTEQWRLVLLCLGLSTIIWVAIYHERVALLRRLRDDHRAFFVAQALTLVLSILTLVGLLELVAQADPQQYRHRAEATRPALDELRRDPAWTPVREDQLLARSTYPTRGLLRLFDFTFDPRPPVTLAALEVEDLGSDSSAEVGYPLRRTRTDRRNAQRLYG